jgi:hypothetical protein
VQGRYDSFEEPVRLVGEQPVVGGHHSLPLPVGRRLDTERVPDGVEDTGLDLLERLEFGLERAGDVADVRFAGVVEEAEQLQAGVVGRQFAAHVQRVEGDAVEVATVAAEPAGVGQARGDVRKSNTAQCV